mmetsp:Transcript_24767/g.69552  ORF Transcript_24767/g.69552 Transcript_24767/m.69552 type:complete len:210 (-) Transcript_24767:73-702(-)
MPSNCRHLSRWGPLPTRDSVAQAARGLARRPSTTRHRLPLDKESREPSQEGPQDEKRGRPPASRSRCCRRREPGSRSHRLARAGSRARASEWRCQQATSISKRMPLDANGQRVALACEERLLQRRLETFRESARYCARQSVPNESLLGSTRPWPPRSRSTSVLPRGKHRIRLDPHRMQHNSSTYRQPSRSLVHCARAQVTNHRRSTPRD